MTSNLLPLFAATQLAGVRVILGLVAAFLPLSLGAKGPVQVRGHMRDGSYVRAHTRAHPGTATNARSSGVNSAVGNYTSAGYTETSAGVGIYETNFFARDSDPLVVLAKNSGKPNQGSRAKFDTVKFGLTAQEVYAILGRPDSFTAAFWTYDGVGWVEFSTTDRVARTRRIAPSGFGAKVSK